MRLMDLLTEDAIQPALASATRDGVVAELVELLVAAGTLPEARRDDAVAAVLRREESMTTGLGAGVAVPHGTCEGLDEVVAALGIHREGVDWGALDGQPVRLVILLLVPPNTFQAHIRTLAGIARVLNDPHLRRLLCEARDADAVLEILVDREEAAV